MPAGRDDLRSASRALKDAAAALSLALGQTLSGAGTQAAQAGREAAQAGRELRDELAQAGREVQDELGRANREVRDEISRADREVREELAQARRELADELAQAARELDEAKARIQGQRRSPRAERTRADLLAAARRVFAEKGYEGASVGDVAAAAGYTKGAVYANFGSKEDLFLELARQIVAADVAAGEADLDLRALLALKPAAEQSTQILMALEIYVYAMRHPEARADLAPLFAIAYDGMAAQVHRAQSGPDGEPTQRERDTALGLAAVHMLASIVEPLERQAGETAGIAARLVDRLLSD